MNVKFNRYSEFARENRDKTNYVKFKRLFLHLENSDLGGIFEEAVIFSLRYYDIENEASICVFDNQLDPSRFLNRNRDFVLAYSDLLCSIYESDRSLFQDFLNTVFKECGECAAGIYTEIQDELKILGYTFDGRLLKTTSGNPIFEQKIQSDLEEMLHGLNPEFVMIKEGALNAVLSNNPDKARHVSASCRELIEKLLKHLVPELEGVSGKFSNEQRIRKLFKESKSTGEIIENTIKLLNSLRDVQNTGVHAKIDNNLALFIYELTEKLMYFILTNFKGKKNN